VGSSGRKKTCSSALGQSIKAKCLVGLFPIQLYRTATGIDRRADLRCAAMRKLLHIVYGVLKSGKPFDSKLALAH
jgi:hypothetical protein